MDFTRRDVLKQGSATTGAALFAGLASGAEDCPASSSTFTLQFENTIKAGDLNSNMEPGTGRTLSFMCRKLILYDCDDEVVRNYNVGSDPEPDWAWGSHAPWDKESFRGITWRWFKKAVSFGLPSDVARQAVRAELEGWIPEDVGEGQLNTYVGSSKVGTYDLSSGNNVTISIDFPTCDHGPADCGSSGGGGGGGGGSSGCSVAETTQSSSELDGHWDSEFTRYTTKTDDPCGLEVEMHGEGDFDLFVTLDGRKPDPNGDFDKRSYKAQPPERIAVEDANVGPDQTFGILVDAYSGSGYYDLTITEKAGGSGGSGGPSGPHAIPGTVQAEDYHRANDRDAENVGGAYRDGAVDIQETASGDGYNVGWISDGEWLEYDVDVESGGDYQLTARVASASDGGQFRVYVDGSPATGSVSTPATGGWQDWTTVTADLSLSAGSHTVRIAMEESHWNVDWFRLTRGGGGGGGGGDGTTSCSKLGVNTKFAHGDNPTKRYIEEAKPQIVLLFADIGRAEQIKQWSPETTVIARPWINNAAPDGKKKPREKGSPWSEDPEAWVDMWFDRHDEMIRRNNEYVDYWQGVNEPYCSKPKWIDGINTAEQLRTERLANEYGAKSCVGNFATTVPPLGNYQHFTDALDAIERHDGILGLHRYNHPTKWDFLRYRQDYDQIRNLGYDVDIAITEMGYASDTLPGWQTKYTEEQYMDKLRTWDNQMRQDDYVVGGAIFSLDIGGQWGKFDLRPILPQLIDHHQSVGQNCGSYAKGGGGGGGGGGEFSVDDQVKAANTANVRPNAGVDSPPKTTVPAGTRGEILQGPKSKDGYTWYEVNYYNAGVSGWSVEVNLDPL